MRREQSLRNLETKRQVEIRAILNAGKAMKFFLGRTPSSGIAAGSATLNHPSTMKTPNDTNNTAGSDCQERLVSPPIDRNQEGMPAHKCLIEIWVHGEWLECEWCPRTKGSEADDGYLGTARTTSRPIQIGFHAWRQNDHEFREYKILGANSEVRRERSEFP